MVPITAGIKKLMPQMKEDKKIIMCLSAKNGANIKINNWPLTTNSVRLIVGKILKHKNKTDTETTNKPVSI